MHNGNLIGLVSSFTKADGSQHAMADVWFARDVAPAEAQMAEPAKRFDLLIAAAADLLPSSVGDQVHVRPLAGSLLPPQQLRFDDVQPDSPLV